MKFGVFAIKSLALHSAGRGLPAKRLAHTFTNAPWYGIVVP
jgi:hypothetical protein